MLKLRYCCTIMMSILFSTHAFSLDYQAERDAALIGRPWYTNAFIPSSEEIEAAYEREELTHIKIRLPLDFERIIREYHEEEKPITLAVSCGDKELPWRAYIASQYNDASKPKFSDFIHVNTPIQQSAVTDNYLSIDPLLGIPPPYQQNDSFISQVSCKGAGHIIMDAMNPYHWTQLHELLNRINIQAHQIIFTAGMGNPQKILFKKHPMLKAQLGMLTPLGKLVEPYFLHFSKKHTLKNFSLLEYFPQPLIENAFNFSLRASQNELTALFMTKSIRCFYVDSHIYLTKFMPFIKVLKNFTDGKCIKNDLVDLIEQKFPDITLARKTFLKEMAMYFISIIKIETLCTSMFEKATHSKFQQMKTIIPIYKRYFETTDFPATFTTSSKIATFFDIPELKAQAWAPGDYPYGERGNIALIFEKK